MPFPRWSTKQIALPLKCWDFKQQKWCTEMKVDEFQIAVSIICHSAIRFVDQLGKSMVTHGKGRNFVVFNNMAFFYPVWLFWTRFSFVSQKMSGNPDKWWGCCFLCNDFSIHKKWKWFYQELIFSDQVVVRCSYTAGTVCYFVVLNDISACCVGY